MQPLVSVVIPTFKRSDVLSRSIDSVLAQTYSNYEIIVVDDNNPDSDERKNTENVMRVYADQHKIKYIKHSKNRNGSAARNTGIKASSGKYIMFLDDDDEFCPVKIYSQVEKMESLDSSYGACYTKYVDVSNEGKIVSTCAENREGMLYVEELKRNLFIHAGSNIMVRKSVVDELNGFDESFNRNQDVEFMVRLLLKYKLAYVDELGLKVHVHKPVNTTRFEDATKLFLDKFSAIIKSLQVDEQNQIYRMINLQLFRYRILEKGYRTKAIRMIFEREVCLIEAFCYAAHLARRKITKKSYGYRNYLY